MKKIPLAIAAGAVAILALSGCTTQADTVSRNLSQDADSFKITREIVVHDDFTDTFLAKITGLCSLGNSDSASETSITCKIGADKYVKEIIRSSKFVTVASIQTEPTTSDPYHYTVIFRPETIVPNIEMQTSGGN